jgi:aspartyl-tRNA(Asn)/glutamyl-tRNA(Gln) amidotransferase subunit A
MDPALGPGNRELMAMNPAHDTRSAPLTADGIVAASASELAGRIRAREISAVEVFDVFAARVEALDPDLNALIRFDPAPGRAEAQRADQRVAAKDSAPLLGVPYTAKDVFWVRDRIVSQGSALFAGFVAPRDSVPVARMRAAGAVLLGTSNCSEFACKGVTTNPLHGPTRNPWDLERTSGGSSGGAASAVAAGFGPLALATDGGGSTRRPAAHVGAVGMKPSTGLVPHPYGFEEPVFGNCVVGQMARCVEDAALMLGVLMGCDRADPTSFVAFDGNVSTRMQAPLSGVCVGFSPRLGLGFPVDVDVAQSVRAAVQRLAARGMQVDEADPVWPADTSEQALMPLQYAGLAAIYGDRYRQRTWDVDPDIAAQIEAGQRTTGADVARALLLREELYRRLDSYFQRFDFLITPTTPCTAWPLPALGPATIEGQPVPPRGHAVFTPIFNHTYLPACSVPCGLDRYGLPIGLQIVGRRLADHRVLALAAMVEADCDADFRLPHFNAPRKGRS